MAKRKATIGKAVERLRYIGIKQIGSFWYSSKDEYLKPFDTADECAEHFNSEKATK